MKISFVTTTPVINVNNWSGTEYYITKALEQNFNVDYITGIKMNLSLSARIKNKIFGSKKQYLLTRNPDVTKDYARQVMRALDPTSDIIFAPSTIPLAYVKSDKSKVFYTDATFASLTNYYKDMSNVSDISLKEGNRLEKEAMETSRLAIFASDWAAESAIKDYGMNPDKVKVVPFGANIDIDQTYKDIKDSVNGKSKDVCKILFIGIDWYRKGGDIVWDTVKYLNEMGMLTELHIAGIDNLPYAEVPSYVKNYGFLDKSKPGEAKKINELISKSHFLFMPSRQEAYGIVFCEAMAYGLPCISAKTGGIPTIIKDNVNGRLLPSESEAKQYAENIYELFDNKSLYTEMSLAAFDDYKKRLNWNSAGQALKELLIEL